MTREQEEYFEWRSTLVQKLQVQGIELNLEGVNFQMTVEIPSSDNFRTMKSWEDFYSELQLLNSSMNWFLYLVFLI
jgi:arginine/serine-rich splicing factor 17